MKHEILLLLWSNSISDTFRLPRTMKNVLFLLLGSLLLATANAAPISVELKGGSVINGDLISWDGQEVQVKAEFGIVKFKKDAISPKTLESLELKSGDPQKLAARITELEATVESLRRDNAALRQQLAQAPAGASATPSAAPASSTNVTATQNKGLTYSRTSSGKRHNSNCRYFDPAKPCASTDGVACKICGG